MKISNVVLTEDHLREVVNYFLTQDAFAFDVEAQGDYRDVSHLASLSWLSLATKGMCVAIPFGHPIGDNIIGEKLLPAVYGPKAKKAGQTYYKKVPAYDDPPAQLTPGRVFEILRPLFFNPFITKIGHDVVYDLASVTKYYGEIPPGPYFDTKIGMWILNENRLRYGLKDYIEDVYGFRYDFEGIGACVEKYPFSLVGYYSFCDSKYAWVVYLDLLQKIEEQGLLPIFGLEMDLLHSMVEMRLAGARVDVDKLHQLQDTLSVKLVEEEGNVYKAAGRKFNINSVPQRQNVLYSPVSEGGQGLKPWKLTTGGMKKKKAKQTLSFSDYSTDETVLSSYPDNELCIALKDYATVSKLLSTYVDSWLGNDEKPTQIYDGHIHAGFLQYGTVTGRFSCRAPNLQNIPRPYTELGSLVRGVFVAEPGGKLVVADYAQIELVVLAHYIEEGALWEGFLKGIDPHTMTAAMVLNKDPADVTKVERQDLGKTLGFAVVYGAGLGKVTSMAKLKNTREARAILDKHKEMFPEIHGFKDSVIKLARSRKPVPYITTLMGRKRRIPALNSSDEGIRMGAERQLFNSLIQGGAADILKMAMIRVDATLPPEIKLSMTVHDEIVLAAPDEFVSQAEQILAEAMTGEGIQKYVKVPLKIDVHSVNRWSEAK